MPKPERHWHVTKHDPIEKLEENLWVVNGRIPGNPRGSRRMAIARLGDGRLVFYNAIPLEEAALAEVEKWGTPSLLILPYNLHMMDGHAFQQRLKLKVYGPASDAKMAARLELAGNFADFPVDKAVRVEPVAGMRSGEPVLIVDSDGGARTSLVFADAFMNVPAGTDAALFARFMGIPGGPKIPWLIKLAFVKDKKALRAHYQRLSAMPSLSRLIPSHGEILDADAGATLARVAASI